MGLLYCGDDERYRHYIQQLAFAPGSTAHPLGRRYLGSLPAVVTDTGVDMMHVEHTRWSAFFLRSTKSLCVPRWVETWLDLSQGIEHLKKNPAYKDALRLIRKYSYTYTVTRDPAAFEHFFRNMYVPSISAIHGESAYLISHEFFQTLCGNADLLLVMQGQEAVAGVLIQYQDSEALMAYAGFKDGDTRYVRSGAAGAFYYFAPVWLHAQGFRRVCFGGSKSFLNDGVLRTKIHKGACFDQRVFTPDERIRLLLYSETQAVRDFLSANPFLCYTGSDELTGALFTSAAACRSADSIAVLLEPYRHYRGINRWQVYLFDENSMPVIETAQSHAAETRRFRTLLN